MPPISHHADCGVLDSQGSSFYQSARHFSAGFRHNSLKGRARHSHLLGGIFLVTSLKVGKTQRFQFFDEKDHAV